MPDADSAWARASVLQPLGGTAYEVRIDGIDDNDEAGQSDWGAGEVRRVDLAGNPLYIVPVYDIGISPVYWLLDASILVAARVLRPREMKALWPQTTRQIYIYIYIYIYIPGTRYTR